MQEFIQSACIEHLDFLDLYSALENEYLHVTEKEASKQFRSLTEIYKISSVQREVETWANYQVSFDGSCVLFRALSCVVPAVCSHLRVAFVQTKKWKYLTVLCTTRTRQQDDVPQRLVLFFGTMACSKNTELHLWAFGFQTKTGNTKPRDHTKAVCSSNTVHHVQLQDLVKRNNWDLAQELMNTDNLYAQAQILQVLLNKEGLYHRIEEKTVEERLDALLRKCCSLQLW